MTPERFIKERTYLVGVTPATICCYEQSSKRFTGALESKEAVTDRIAELKERGLSHISINTHRRCINAYFRWSHEQHGRELIKIPRLNEEQKIISAFNPEPISNSVIFHKSIFYFPALKTTAYGG